MKNNVEKGIIITKEKRTSILTMLKATLIAYAITCISFIACALLLRYTAFKEENVSIFVTITCVLSVLISGFDSAKSVPKNGWFWGLVAGAVYAVIWVFFGILFTVNFGIDSRTLTIVILSIAAGGLGGVIGINLKKA